MPDRPQTYRDDLQSALIHVLDSPHGGQRISKPAFDSWSKAVNQQMGVYPSAYPEEMYDAMWSLVRQGLVYLDTVSQDPRSWSFRLTEAGKAAANDQEANPDNSSRFIQRLAAQVPDASPIVMQYANEALTSYSSRCYLASAVMLGVASEADFLEMARAFADWLPEKEGRNLKDVIEGKRSNFINRFEEFRKRIDSHKHRLPDNLSDGMALTLDAVLDLLRINRNEAGHPTGKQFDRADAFINLQMFARYLEKMYRLKGFFERNRQTATHWNGES